MRANTLVNVAVRRDGNANCLDRCDRLSRCQRRNGAAPTNDAVEMMLTVPRKELDVPDLADFFKAHTVAVTGEGPGLLGDAGDTTHSQAPCSNAGLLASRREGHTP